jgi:hypothetical protein
MILFSSAHSKILRRAMLESGITLEAQDWSIITEYKHA